MNDKEEKLFRLALDPAAQPGEADNAAVALIRLMRARAADPYDHGEAHAFKVPKWKPKRDS